MFRRLPLVLGLAIAVLAAGTALADQRETEQFHKSVPFPSGGTLKLHNFSGKVSIVGADGTDVVIDAVRRAARDRLDHIRIDVATSGSTVEIEANRRDPSWNERNDNVVETEFEIKVPHSAALDIKVFSSPVTIGAVSGAIKIDAFSANVTVDQGPGSVQAKTFSGAIEVRLAPGAGRPDLDLHTFSGDIAVSVPASARADVEFDSFSGDLESDLDLTLKSKSRRRMQATLGGEGAGAAGLLRLKTFSGDVRIKR